MTNLNVLRDRLLAVMSRCVNLCFGELHKKKLRSFERRQCFGGEFLWWVVWRVGGFGSDVAREVNL
jgi:hypothetical protein